MIYERYPDELAHHGVKGMKWGVRKIKNNLTVKDVENVTKSSNSISSGTKGISDYVRRQKVNKQLKKTKIAGMSDDELRRKVNRMTLEQNYSRLKANEVSTGMDHVSSVLRVAADTVAVVGGAAAIGLTIKSLMKD